ncbi:MAG: hypothetical protein GPJ54_00255 [Candidatus Heimdallarchaeota archaeon]|nr:hypothetical protein [Candidatus Heimdallarchaeota archaeon]
MIILIFTSLIPVNIIILNAASIGSPKNINGFFNPRIDGVIDKLSSSSTISEWEDAKTEIVEFQPAASSNLILNQAINPITSSISSKMVSNNLFLSFEFPELVSSVELQLDIDNDGSVSNGDLKLIGNKAYDPIKSNQNNNAELFSIDNKLKIYYNGLWSDPTVLNPNLWKIKEWNLDNPNWDPVASGFNKYNELISKTGKIALSEPDLFIRNNEGKTSDSVEIQFLPSSYYELLDLTLPNLKLTNVSLDKVSYGIIIASATGIKYGYPSKPTTNSAQEKEVSVFAVYNVVVVSDTKLDIDLAIDHIEVTQAIQTEDNFIRLVYGKTTKVRVFINNPIHLPVLVEVRLTGSALQVPNMFDFGTLTQRFFAPPIAYRTNRTDAVIFELPGGWTHVPFLILKAEVVPVDHVDTRIDDNSKTDGFFFKKTHVMNILYVRVNKGTASQPNQTSSAALVKQFNFIKNVFPTKSINFIELDWSVIGAWGGRYDRDEVLSELTDYAMLITLAIILQRTLHLPTRYPIPDQIIGFTAGGGGQSSPSWYNGLPSMASVVGTLFSPDVAAHEVNHNIGDNNWGRHVSYPNNGVNDPNWGCGADGSDRSWPSNNDNLNQLYPTTLGLRNLNNDIIDSNENDFMSYCYSDKYPYSWISDYRWEFLIDRLEGFVPGMPVHPIFTSKLNINEEVNKESINIDFTLNSTRKITGYIHKDGTAKFEPSYNLPGSFNVIPSVEKGIIPTHTIEVDFINQTTNSYSLFVDLNVLPDEFHYARDKHGFNLWIDDDGQISAVRIKDSSGNILDEITGSEFSVDDVDIISPFSIVRDEIFDIKWEYVNLINQTNIYSQLQYSHDGSSWINIGRQTDENILQGVVFGNNIPGGDNGQFRLILSDGFNSKIINDQDVIASPLLIPRIQIERNSMTDDGKTIIPNRGNLNSTVGSSISLTASGFDPQIGDIDPNSIYWNIKKIGNDGNILYQNELDIYGSNFSYKFVQDGNYIVTAIVKNIEGVEVSNSVFIDVNNAVQGSREKYLEFLSILDKILDRDETTSSHEDTKESPTGSLSFPISSLILLTIMLPILKFYNRKYRII